MPNPQILSEEEIDNILDSPLEEYYQINYQRELIMKTNKPPQQPIALPHGRGRSVVLQDILNIYNTDEMCCVDFRVPLPNEAYFDTNGRWRFQHENPPRAITTPRLILKRPQE